MFQPSIEEIKSFKENKEYKRIPVYGEILSDTKTSVEVLRRLKLLSKHCYMLESVEDSKNWGRYSFLGFDPILEITCHNGLLNIKGESSFTKDSDDLDFSTETNNPGDYIRQIINDYKSPSFSNLPPFTGGLVGYFSYDYIKYAEPSLNLDAKDDDSFKDVDLMLFDKVIVFDNFKQKIIIISNMELTDDLESLEINYKKTCESIEEIINVIKADSILELDYKYNSDNKCESGSYKIPNLKLKSEFKPLFSKDEYSNMVLKAKNYIKEGDIFQVVLSNRIEAEIEGSLFDTYRILRTTNPSPYMFYFSSDDIEMVGASPETLVKLVDDEVYTFPLAGTRPRGKTAKEDDELEEELLADTKELAEHNMLVDLGRNDLGKISEFGSVNVDKYLDVVKFSHVMHIGSTVKSKLRDDCDYISTINSILPAGTLSGAPKIRACEIINELENNKRGIYGGAIGYIDLSGNLDTCIAIRLAFSKNNKVYIRSGAGIVADSVPENEFQECLNKAQAVIDALELANGGI